jgi:hypothetical protein
MHCRCTATVLALALFVVLPSMGRAQESGMRGTWTLNREQSDDVHASINRAVARMNVVMRQIVRPRLRNTNEVYPGAVIDYDDHTVRVDMRDGPSVTTPANGEPVLWHRGTGRACPEVGGQCVRVITTWENGHLEQTFSADDAQRVNDFSVSPDGRTLTMHVTIISPRLPSPLTYRLIYDRAA